MHLNALNPPKLTMQVLEHFHYAAEAYGVDGLVFSMRPDVGPALVVPSFGETWEGSKLGGSRIFLAPNKQWNFISARFLEHITEEIIRIEIDIEFKTDISITTITAWWFRTFFIFPYIVNNHPT